MGVRYEWMYDPGVEPVEPDTELGDNVTDTEALLISAGGTVVVVEGNLVEFLEAVRQAVENPTGEGWKV